MKSILLFAVLFSFLSVIHGFSGYKSVANPLSEEENAHLQQVCGVPPVSRSRRSIHSEHVDRSQAPWVVSMIYNYRSWTPTMDENDIIFESSQHCSGSLISNRHVLLAAHCVKQIKNLDRTRFVIHKKCGEPSAYGCMANDLISMHKSARAYVSSLYDPDYQVLLHHGDMTVVELTTNVTFNEDVWPVCLGDYLPSAGDKLDEYGYGMDHTWERMGHLQHIPATVVSHEDCLREEQKKAPGYKMIDLICTTSKYQHSCSGDSGSGYIANRNGRRTVVGVLSNGFVCAGHPPIYMMGADFYNDKTVAVAAHISWICEATGICANSEVIEDVKTWKELPNRRIERFDVLVPPKIDEMYVVKKV